MRAEGAGEVLRGIAGEPLVLRAQQTGIALALVPLVMVAMNLVYALAAYPFGKLSDRVSYSRLLAGGLLVLIAADLVLAASSHWSTLLGGVGGKGDKRYSIGATFTRRGNLSLGVTYLGYLGDASLAPLTSRLLTDRDQLSVTMKYTF